MKFLHSIFLALLLLVGGPAWSADPCQIAERCGSVPPTAVEEPIDLARVVMFYEQHRGGRYEREKRRQVIVGANQVLRFAAHDISRGGVVLALQAGKNDLLVDDVEHTSVTVPAGAKVAQFLVSEADLKPGWRRVQVREPDGRKSPTWFVHVGTLTADRVVPVSTSVFDWTHGGPVMHRWAWVPADATPSRYPIQIRTWTPFSTALAGKDLHLSTLVPNTGPSRIDFGSTPWSTYGKQSYYYSDFVRKFPVTPQLDGVPGIATMAMPTHIEMGRATQTTAPGSPGVNAVYVLNPWSLSRINEDGSKRTLVGWRGWPGALELVGNWTAVPPERRGLHEAWAFRFDPSSLGIDVNAPLIGGRPPHSGNPTGFIADTQNNRVLKVVFDGKSHDTPAVVTEFITGISDPFGLAVWRDELIVSERLAQRIAAYDLATGAFKRVVQTCDGTHYAMGLDREPVRLVPATAEAAALAKRREAPCVAPEGMDLDGDELVFASVSQAQVRRLHLVDGTLKVQGNLPIDAGANYVQVAANDGTWGPAGTVFATTWSGTQFGYPIALKADGTRWLYMQNSQASPEAGRGPMWASKSYSAAVGVRGGRLVFGSSDFGLWQAGRASANDPVMDVKRYDAGRKQLDNLLYGVGGYSPYGYPLPWGKSDDLDYFLQSHGHVR